MIGRIIATGVREALIRLDAAVLAAARQLLGQSAAYAAEHARATTTFKDGPKPTLRKSIRRGATGPFKLFVVASARHAKFVEDPTKPHIIRAKPPRKALRFVIGGDTLFRASVRHPGTKGTRFMRDARDDAERQLMRFVEDGMPRVIRG